MEHPLAEEALVERAKTGVAGAFDALSQPYVGMLHKLAYRLVNHPDDAEDLVQDSLLQAFRKLDSFRGEAKFSTWLLSIATRKCIDHLRKKKRWPLTCQDTGARYHTDSPALMSKLEEIAATPGFRYEYREHIAYCFACVGRSLDAEQSATLVLREVLELSNGEAAKVLGLSLSTFRHRLSSARKFMMAEFEGRCALVGKQGVCWQCEALRTALPRGGSGGGGAGDGAGGG